MVSPQLMAATLRIVLLLALGLSLVQAKHYKLFVLTGQSNSLGTTAGGEPDPGPETDPADARAKFFWRNVADASTSLDGSGAVFGTGGELVLQDSGPLADRNFYRVGVGLP
jgi:hypothetical protein